MLRPRIIPCLLVRDGGLVKTIGFKDAKYIGDPLNAVKIFNEKEADELMVLDIDATTEARSPNFKMIKELAVESRMPLCCGGGVKTAAEAKHIVSLGVEKVSISSAAIENPSLISEISNEIGRQSVVVVVDVRKRGDDYIVWTHNASRNTDRSVFEVVKQAESLGAGEIVVNSIDNDGQMKGYALDLARRIRDTIGIPMTFLGGAGSLNDIAALLNTCEIVGAAAGSLFVFKGAYRAVLINYPDAAQKEAIIRRAQRCEMQDSREHHV